MPHTGGKRFAAEAPITDAAALAGGGRAERRGRSAQGGAVELYPPQVVLEGERSPQQLMVRAKYSDGTDRDVTSLAVFLTQ